MATLLKKMSTKNIICNPKEALRLIDKDGEVKEIYKILGIVTGFKAGEGDYGSYVAFAGQFHAVNTVTGEEFESGKAFLPEPLPGMIQAALSNSDSVEFALSVSMKRRDDLGIGYEYLVSPIVDTKRADPLAHLKAAVKGALPAPVAEVDNGPTGFENHDKEEAPVKTKKK